MSKSVTLCEMQKEGCVNPTFCIRSTFTQPSGILALSFIIFRPLAPPTEDSLEQLFLKLKHVEHRELGISLPILRKVYKTRNWLIDRLHKVVRSSCNGGEKIAAEDIYYILLHFSGQLDYAKVFFLFTLFNSDKESDSDSIRDRRSLTISKSKHNEYL